MFGSIISAFWKVFIRLFEKIYCRVEDRNILTSFDVGRIDKKVLEHINVCEYKFSLGLKDHFNLELLVFVITVLYFSIVIADTIFFRFFRS